MIRRYSKFNHTHRFNRFANRKHIAGKTLDFNSLYRLLDKYDISMVDSEDVVGRDGQTGVRCLIEPLYYSRQQEAFKSASEELAQYDNVIVNGNGAQYRYAPQIIHPTIIVLDTEESEDLSDEEDSFEASRKSYRHSVAGRQAKQKKYTQREIKKMVDSGEAVDISMWSDKELNALRKKGLETVSISKGVNGMNGGLFKDREGNLYAIPSRSTNLFRLV